MAQRGDGINAIDRQGGPDTGERQQLCRGERLPIDHDGEYELQGGRQVLDQPDGGQTQALRGLQKQHQRYDSSG